MKKNIFLVGCGNIGSRHLQALVKLPFKVDIHIVEKSNESKILAINRLKEIKFNKKNFNFFWYNSVDQLTSSSDLVIISTLSRGRVDLILSLLKNENKKFLIEKPVCQSKKEYDHLLSQMNLFNATGWINTNRRYFESYQKIKNDLNNCKFININVVSTASGLGTNAIHFLDLFSWLIDDSKIKLNGEFLNPKLFFNKRGKEFKEFYGTIFGSGKNNSSITLNFLPSKNESIFLTISTDSVTYVIDELNQNALKIGKTNKKFNFIYDHVSQSTTKIVMDILEKNKSFLPQLDESYVNHIELFRIFNLHIKKQLKRDISLCPIT
jgi:predicted dehydrogenase